MIELDLISLATGAVVGVIVVALCIIILDRI